MKLLRAALDGAGLQSVGVPAADDWYPPGLWQIVYDMQKDPALYASVSAVAVHVAGEEARSGIINHNCKHVISHSGTLDGHESVPAAAVSLGKPIWQSEEHFGVPDGNGAPAWQWQAAAGVALQLNHNWIDNSMWCRHDALCRVLSIFMQI